jgi:hypothetical protein
VLHIALLTASLVFAELPVEAPIVPGSVPLEDPGRYRSRRSYQDTVLYYERVFRRVAGERWHNIVNLPGIKAKNVESRRSKTNWEYINIYETRGQVCIYVIPRERAPEPQKKKR